MTHRKLRPLAERLADSRRRSEQALRQKCPTCGKLMRSVNGNRGVYACAACNGGL